MMLTAAPRLMRATTRRVTLAASGVLVALGGARFALAQGTASYINAYCAGQQPTQLSSTIGPVAVTCTNANPAQSVALGTASTSASAINGVLRASASYSPASVPQGLVNGGTGVTASAVWQDVIVVSSNGVAPSFGRFYFSWNGMLTALGSPSTASAAFVTSVSNVTQSRNPSAQDADVPINQSFSFIAPIQQFNQLRYFNVYIALIANVTGTGRNTDAGASALFSNSGGITQVDLLDANQQVMSGVTYQFQNGGQLYVPSSVPEPGTVGLLAAGLLAMGVALRRRRTS